MNRFLSSALLLALATPALAVPTTVTHQGRVFDALGAPLTGQTSGNPNSSANGGCDFGPWAAQILMRDQDVSSVTTVFGQSPSATWDGQPYEHRYYFR